MAPAKSSYLVLILCSEIHMLRMHRPTLKMRKNLKLTSHDERSRRGTDVSDHFSSFSDFNAAGAEQEQDRSHFYRPDVQIVSAANS